MQEVIGSTPIFSTLKISHLQRFVSGFFYTRANNFAHKPKLMKRAQISTPTIIPNNIGNGFSLSHVIQSVYIIYHTYN
jgi:hypothetical protein